MYATILLFYLIEIQQLVGMHPGASAFICMSDAGISDAPGCIPTLAHIIRGTKIRIISVCCTCIIALFLCVIAHVLQIAECINTLLCNTLHFWHGI